MSGLTRGGAVMLLLLFPLIVSANGWRRTTTTSSYYYAPAAPPAYVIYDYPVYVTPTAPVCIPQAPQAKLYAQPLPAGPSGTAPSGVVPKTTEPPLSPTPKPGVTESRSFFNAYTVAPRANDKPAAARIPVGFWNLTDHDITLTVDKSTHVLPRGKNLKLDLARQFIWRVDARDSLTEQVPGSEAGLEIVIRR